MLLCTVMARVCDEKRGGFCRKVMGTKEEKRKAAEEVVDQCGSRSRDQGLSGRKGITERHGGKCIHT